MKNLDVNAAIWCIFLSVTLQAAVHLGKDFLENSTFYQKTTPEVCEILHGKS